VAALSVVSWVQENLLAGRRPIVVNDFLLINKRGVVNDLPSSGFSGVSPQVS
jgi:hypothetical protein